MYPLLVNMFDFCCCYRVRILLVAIKREGGGGGGVTTYIFLNTDVTPWKPKEIQSPGQVFSQITNPNPGQIIYVINMRPKAGETWFLCKLTYSAVPNQCVSNIVEIMVLHPIKPCYYIIFSILWYKTGRENGSRTTHVPTPGRSFYFWMKTQPNAGVCRLCKPITGGGGILIHSLTRVTPPPSQLKLILLITTLYSACICV